MSESQSGAAMGHQHDAALVGALEDLLARARSGELVSIAVAGETSDNCIATLYEGRDRDNYRLIGALFELQRRLLQLVTESEVEASWP